VNYACHPVSLGGKNRMLSSDYIGAMREVIESRTSGHCLFLHGASGDVTPRRSYEADVEVADQNGMELGHSALAALYAMYPAGKQLQYIGTEESGTTLGLWGLAQRDDLRTQLAVEIVKTELCLKNMPQREEIEQRLKN
jgi:hypothetical protein